MSSPNYSYSNEVYDLFKDQELCDITLVAGIDGIRFVAQNDLDFNEFI